MKKDLFLSPLGTLYLETIASDESKPTAYEKELEKIFDAGAPRGLLFLAFFKQPETSSDGIAHHSPSITFWQEFSRNFIKIASRSIESTSSDLAVSAPVPNATELQKIIEQAPFIHGSEYLTVEQLQLVWRALYGALHKELEQAGSLKNFIHSQDPMWNLVGRICFNLAEKKESSDYPFAFLATYTTNVSSSQILKHVPLKNALEEYSGNDNKASLIALLAPLQKAATTSTCIKNLIDSGKIFHPLAWTAHEAHLFLKDVPLFEHAGIVVRIPNWWNPKQPPRARVDIALGKQKESLVGIDNLLDFNVRIALANGQELSDDEWSQLLHEQESLVKIKGQWIEVNPEKLNHVLSHWKSIQKSVKEGGLTFAEGMRLLSGAPHGASDTGVNIAQINEWSHVHAGDWLKKTLDNLRTPEGYLSKTEEMILQSHLKATLRPYQIQGVQWLSLLYTLGLGGCLADDMGLGKTIQIIALLLLVKHQPRENSQQPLPPSILVVPASLLGNWKTELQKFAPTLKVYFLHTSIKSETPITNNDLPDFNAFDLVITSYGFTHRLAILRQQIWNIIILDEAQAIKNPNTKQRTALKEFKGRLRITMTGTPVENNLIDVWSLFDFFAPGLLGTLKVFGNYIQKANDAESPFGKAFYSSLRMLLHPYILRRLKTDKRIIQDLPDKVEVVTYCSLTQKQIQLYQQAIDEFDRLLTSEETGSIQRQGLIFSYLSRFKQICNHPDQWLGYGTYDPSASGKFLRLRELCADIVTKQEKVLIFTQFQEIVPILAGYLQTIFKHEGFILHGGTPIKKRSSLVADFNNKEGASFFVISLKAGGTGLNLTSASHVIHFDRWWNPAVENQATDRAYRIGQKKNVMVSKFVCQGTIEEKIDALIASKKALSSDVLSKDSEISLSQLTNEQLIAMIKLDIHKAVEEL